MRQRVVGVILLALAFGGVVAVAEGAGKRAKGAKSFPPASEVEPFIRGMTVSFAGTKPVEFMVWVPRSMTMANMREHMRTARMLPVDAWVLDLKERRLPVRGARLTDAKGKAVAPREPGHWRVEAPPKGHFSLTVPRVGSAWRLWVAYNPFMASLSRGLALRVGEKPGAVFFSTPGDGPFEVRLKAVTGTPKAVLLDPKGKPVAEGRVTARGLALKGVCEIGPWRLDLSGPGVVEITTRNTRPWMAFAPWDVFSPDVPSVAIEGETRLKPKQRLRLRAVVTDPNNDIASIVWTLPEGKTVRGATLDLPVTRFDTFPVKVDVRDREGNTAEANALVDPPQPDLRKRPGVILIEAEDFAREKNGKVYVTDRHANSGKMITKWHRGKGHFVEWKFRVGVPGLYDIYARYGSAETPRRRLRIDRRIPDKAYACVALPTTGGYGYAPNHWRVARLGPPVKLSKGEHTLRLNNQWAEQRDGMALDYLLLVKR